MMVRALDVRDEKKILSLLRILQSEGHDLSVLSYLKDHASLLRALRDEVIVGSFDGEDLVGILRSSRDSRHPHKCKLCIAFKNDYTGKGNALHILEEAEPIMKKAGIEIIHALIFSDNKKSIAFAEKAGFTYCGKFPYHHKVDGVVIDDMVYAKEL